MKINREIDKLNDLFVRYLLGKNGNENMLEDMVNAALSDFNFEEVKDLEIIDPYNLSENIDLKESIIDIPKGTPSAKAKTKDNQTVIIEIKLCGNMDFVKRIFYYISKNIVNELKEGEDYKKLPRIISINLLNFNLDFGDEGKPHRCFKLIDTKNHNIDLDFIQMHIIEAKRFIEIIEKSTLNELKKNRLLTWMKFFTSKNLKAIEKELMEANPIMTKVIEEYKRFTSDDKLMRAYDARDAFLLGQKMMLNREREEGIKEGIEKRNYTIAKLMKKENIDIETIKRITGLTVKEIKKL
ncbi:Rpn family recombination-promoting nuclease/putative transposase [Brachyspira aalborgi]|uniref:Rpn family recombination-promoting nuclease/putative transposase n=1 Tax=Brachyspira aalborgi TaxID=29522 RepID=A0AB38Q1D0_9SPIR|nr:Rpn family recombination-promoting nuclease/putative transposase [Brachyspira aalborgi]TXJ16686.1 Rpn family recombination-promoting nuclease/putative transposase [Brachyspira aalborgi]TXJ22096.1 Rpn family recombination-promoting nuclease/putative transposase [Brachyspira aalborgi]TXJ26873.1 Rpn family recombination-promoting nuclease/putative transposase [Brachyspira aalborgi]TXJ50642.1 Rpn family recombination-promoting nuclease/putative transposase [Brachyspira aalborgi]